MAKPGPGFRIRSAETPGGMIGLSTRGSQMATRGNEMARDGPTVTGGAPGAPVLSIVIPAYNEERRLPRALESVARWIAGQRIAVEVIVVENGSVDGTVRIVERFQADHPYVRLIKGLPAGKGGAVRAGMLAARGQLRFLCDADLSMPIEELDKFLPAAIGTVDVAVASRELPGAKRIGEPPLRHAMGRIYNLIVKAVAVPGIEDSQCGFKMFSARATDDVFACARLSGWGFDPEVLFVARKRGYRVHEVPVEWHYNADSRVRPIHDSVTMLRDLFRIRINDWRGVYDG
jgi:dolichyl-phosphate beta-glucosyltransferase